MRTELVYDRAAGAYWLASGRCGDRRVLAEGGTRREAIRNFAIAFGESTRRRKPDYEVSHA